jgi:DNA-binding transcriptional LysR family regulator
MARQFDHMADVEAFVTIVDKGTISAAAVALGTTPSVLSRAVARLEARLGVQLMRRTTRRLSVTDAGNLYLEQARSAFGLIADAERAIQGQDGALSGKVRISVPTTYGHYRLPALLRPFMQRHPQVSIELSISNRNVDLVAEGYDMAIRLGELADSGLAAKRLGEEAVCLVAAPDYLRQAGMPRDLDELSRHACLPFILPSSGRQAPWLLRVDSADVDWLAPPRMLVADDVLGVVSLAQQGLGICQTYHFIAEDRLASGQLVEVLPALRGRSRPFSLIYPPHRRMSAASRALIDCLPGGC